MYLALVLGMLIGATYLFAIGANVAGFSWLVICGLLAFVAAKIDAEKWSRGL